MPAKVSVNARPIGDGRVGERGRRGEPVRGADVGADGRCGDRGAAGADQGEDQQQQAGGGDGLTEPQVDAGAVLRRPRRAGTANMALASSEPQIAPTIWATV